MKELKTMLTGQRWPVTLLAACGLINAALILLLNQGYARILNAALGRTSYGIVETALLLTAVVLVNGVINIAEHRLYGSIAENAGHRLRTRTTERLLKTECAALQQHHAGESLARASLELKQATDWVRTQFCPAVIEAAVLLCVFAAMLAVNPLLTLAAFIFVPAITAYAVRASKPIRAAVSDQQAALSRSFALTKSVMDAFPIVKVFDMSSRLQQKFNHATDEAVTLAVRANSVERLLMTVNGFATLVPVIILLGLGGSLVINGAMTAGALLAYLNLSNFITGPLMNLPNRIASARAFCANVARVVELLSAPTEAQRIADGRREDLSGKNAIELTNVSFSYEDGQPVLRHVSLSMPQGSRVALVGPSGCGKSTVIKLLAALYMPQDGRVAVLGRDTRKWELAELRRKIAVVMQDPFLFPGSILENITCGNDMPMDQVLAATQAAGLGEFVKELPCGLETIVGERGAKLSGGQKQRVAIARALAKDAPILLLDEATSALDSGTEHDIQKSLDKLMQGRTTLIITHRLSGIREADCIYCMKNGSIAEHGTHEELMVLNGIYAGLSKIHDVLPQPDEGGQYV